MEDRNICPGFAQIERMDEGDFAYRYLPKTYKYYLRRNLDRNFPDESIDKFDSFIRKEIPIFQFLIDQYYAQKRSPRLSLASLSDDRIVLNQLDEDILGYLANMKSREYLLKLKKHYIIMLENCLVRTIKESKGR